MNLYLLERTDGWGYDDYSAAVVVAANQSDACKVNPDRADAWDSKYTSWASSPDKVKATFIGTATEDVPTTDLGIVLASFHAG